jgi:predicted transcriptional regulator
MLKGSWRAFLDGVRGAAHEPDPLGSLGRLEREVMDVVWQTGRARVRDVQGRLPRPAAYTTVMTTMDRLFKKGLLERVRERRAYVYRATVTQQAVKAAVASGLLRGLLEAGPQGARPVLSNLVDVIGEFDAALLDELDELLRQKRQRK